ncbi:MAG: molybdenum cofactor guanylyltransferase [Mycobacteriaceae bacterium]|nr:molybdenum cofactor guanylyltransferase [Mycobacteriaceae bacterium]
MTPGLLTEVGEIVLQSVAVAGVVLAGGESRRMGRDKATLPFFRSADGRDSQATMVEHVVSVVRQRCQPVFVVAAVGQALPALSVPILRDELRGQGPLLATGRGLRAAAEAGLERAFVCAVDMPFVNAAFIDDLARRAAQLDADVVLPWDGQDHYLAAVYRTGLVDRIDAALAAGQRSMRSLVDASDAQRVVLTDSRVLTNVNSADELHALPRV